MAPCKPGRVQLFKMAIAVACAVGFLYQAVGVVLYFQSYPAVVSSIFAQDEAEFPAVTVCFEAWFNTTKICDHFPNNCSRKDVMLLYAQPKFLDSIALRRFGYPDTKKLFTCRMFSHVESCEPFDCLDWIERKFFRPPAQMCYTFDTEQLPREHPFYRCQTPWMYELSFEATWDARKLFAAYKREAHSVIVHRSQRHSPGKLDGIVLRDNFLYEVSIQQKVTLRLPDPYSTQCVEYDAKGKFEHFLGYETQALCYQTCIIHVEMKECGCAFYTWEFSTAYTDRICALHEMEQCARKLKSNGSYNPCETTCNLACKETEYDARLSGFTKYQVHDKNIGRIGLYLSFATSAVEVFRYEPAIKAGQVFGYVGSYQEIWLGVSILSSIFFIAKTAKRLPKERTGAHRLSCFGLYKPRRMTTRVIPLTFVARNTSIERSGY